MRLLKQSPFLIALLVPILAFADPNGANPCISGQQFSGTDPTGQPNCVTPPLSNQNSSSLITQVGGQIFIDARVEASQAIQADKYFELVSQSTPTTPSSTHARLWLQPMGTKYNLNIIFGDGTIVAVAHN